MTKTITREQLLARLRIDYDKARYNKARLEFRNEPTGHAQCQLDMLMDLLIESKKLDQEGINNLWGNMGYNDAQEEV